MVNIINPKVNVIDYGPKLTLPNGEAITPDEFVYGASGITYKDTGVLGEMMDMKKEGKDFREKMISSLIKSAGSGHASMATTPAFWLYLEGNSSKMVDSIFTGARFSSSLMPSGRRVPVTKEQIVIPQEIVDKGFTNLYMQVSEKNIELYEKLQTQGVPKEEAAKIVQYGHKGGGFLYMPLETLICVSRNIKEKGGMIPGEAREIVSQLEGFIHENGMGVVYEARSNAPRTGCPNPNIFHRRKNLAQELIENNYGDILSSDDPQLISAMQIPSEERDERIRSYLEKRKTFFSSKERVEYFWKDMLRELELIVEDYNDSVSVKTISNSPWRVWGEVKRHRTLGQTTESVYNGVDRAKKIVHGDNATYGSSNRFNEVFSMPPQIGENPELLKSWLGAFSDSVVAYEKMVDGGVKESDAIMVIPRGLKLGIVKTHDLYNLTTGYMSLRLCNTAEPEMRRTTEKERDLVLNSNEIPETVKKLISPKCCYVGFCPDRYCGKVNAVSPFYNKEEHIAMKATREDFIKDEIDNWHPED